MALKNTNRRDRHRESIEHKTVQVCLDQLKPYARNARTHSDRQVGQIAESIAQFGFVNPIIAAADGNIVAGHGRYMAARSLGMVEVPVVYLSHLSDAEIRAYRIADNRLAEKAGWDESILAIEFAELDELLIDIDLEITGFETGEIDVLLSGKHDDSDDADIGLEPATGAAATRPGDVWILAQHRLICGDARDPDTYQALMGSELADCVFTDPPYNVAIDGHVCGGGRVQHREFAMASGEMSPAGFTEFLTSSLAPMAKFSRNGSIHFVCMDWRHIVELHAAGKDVYTELKNLIVWTKTNAGMGSFYRSQHELIFVFKHGTEPHTNNFGLGQAGRNRSNVWQYAGVNSFGKTREDLVLHPTVKPVAMVADAIRDVTRRGGIVLDGFGGSGTTLIAAEQTRRVARLIELDPAYCDVICNRFHRLAGKEAHLEATGESFSAVAARRSEEAPSEDVSDD